MKIPNSHPQKGMATILTVLLIGVSAMLITAGVAKSLMSKQQSSVAAHAQTNAQLLAWAGVQAFREYLLADGKKNIENVKNLHNKSVNLKYQTDLHDISAQNIQVTGCSEQNSICIVTADISAHHIRSKAATTIQAVYELTLKDGLITTAAEAAKLNYTGDLFLSGTTLKSETKNNHVTLNVDGVASIQAGFKTENIDVLTINATDDVIIDCSLTQCGNTLINVNSRGKVTITNPGRFGTIQALDKVTLSTAVHAETISTTGDVDLNLKSTANLIHAGGNVEIGSGSFANQIYANGNVQIGTLVPPTSGTANVVYALGHVHLYANSAVNGNVESRQYIDVSASRINGDAKAYYYVDLSSFSSVNGSIYAKGQQTINGTLGDYAVRLSTSKVNGNIYANKDMLFLDLSRNDVKGNVHLGGKLVGLRSGIQGDLIEKGNSSKKDPVPYLDFEIPQIVDSSTIEASINKYMNFSTRVDVTKYLYDANYIFTQSHGVARVYLNHLKNVNTGITYIYEDKQQKIRKSNGETESVNDGQAFYLGKYEHNGKVYAGAICETVDKESARIKSGLCTSDIIGYFPRLEINLVGDSDVLNTFGLPTDYDYSSPVNTWYIRSHKPSSLDNAAFAPGVIYVDGKLILSGDENLLGDSSTTGFTNSFLATGSIDSIAMSPRIYSPYNVLREKNNADVICSRALQTQMGTKFSSSVPATTPITQSNRFLMPVNLCENDHDFLFNMNKNDKNETIQLDFDNSKTQIPKLDLGYVALMSNRAIRIGSCSQIYGDVLAGSAVEGSKGCLKGTMEIVGSVSSQGNPITDIDIEPNNTFGAGSKLVVPDSKFTNIKNTEATTTKQGTFAENVSLMWSRYH